MQECSVLAREVGRESAPGEWGDMGTGAALGHGHEQQLSEGSGRGEGRAPGLAPFSGVAGQTRLLALLQRDLAPLTTNENLPQPRLSGARSQRGQRGTCGE